jgi:DnaK suppressor protein
LFKRRDSANNCLHVGGLSLRRAVREGAAPRSQILQGEAMSITKQQLKALQHQLQARLAEASSPEVRKGLVAETAADPLDDAVARNALDVAVTTVNSDYATRRAIKAALERIRSGEYGHCGRCGDPIEPRRLQALPWAANCVACQQEVEEELRYETTQVA